jgi:hypothetical protein
MRYHLLIRLWDRDEIGALIEFSGMRETGGLL